MHALKLSWQLRSLILSVHENVNKSNTWTCQQTLASCTAQRGLSYESCQESCRINAQVDTSYCVIRICQQSFVTPMHFMILDNKKPLVETRGCTKSNTNITSVNRVYWQHKSQGCKLSTILSVKPKVLTINLPNDFWILMSSKLAPPILLITSFGYILKLLLQNFSSCPNKKCFSPCLVVTFKVQL